MQKNSCVIMPAPGQQPIIMFLGPDCCGKNSLMHGLAKEFGYKYFMSPRSPICNIVYDQIYNRNEELEKENLRLVLSFLKLKTYFILVQAKPEILVQRALARNEKHVRTIADFKRHIKLYNKIFNICKTNLAPQYAYRFIKIDNSGDLQKTVMKLKNILESSKAIG